ncbi:MAG: DUF2442 domain-containing protein [Ginsengibacter sp.]
MGQNNVLQPSRKNRSNKTENIRVTGAVLIEPFVLKVFFNNSEYRIIDFRPFFNTLKGYYEKWNKPSAFKKFKIENGELCWGKNADVQLHPVDVYYNSLLHPLHDQLTEAIMII